MLKQNSAFIFTLMLIYHVLKMSVCECRWCGEESWSCYLPCCCSASPQGLLWSMTLINLAEITSRAVHGFIDCINDIILFFPQSALILTMEAKSQGEIFRVERSSFMRSFFTYHAFSLSYNHVPENLHHQSFHITWLNAG